MENYILKDERNRLYAYATAICGNIFTAQKYCTGGQVAGKTKIAQPQFELLLRALQASNAEKHSTLFSYENDDGAYARLRAVSEKQAAWSAFHTAIAVS